MIEDDVVRFVRSYIEGLFPKVCSCCGRRFESLHEYLELTTHVGTPVLYETVGEYTLADPLGPMSHANCACGTTLTVGAEGIPPAKLAELLAWAKAESIKRSISVREVISHIRDRIDASVYRDAEERGGQ